MNPSRSSIDSRAARILRDLREEHPRRPSFGQLRARHACVVKILQHCVCRALIQLPLLLCFLCVSSPIEFTLIPRVAKNYTDVQLALRHADHLCTLLSYQDRTIKNTYLHRIAMLQHVFTRVIPLPMPWNHPLKSKLCFWTQPLRYSDQVDIMRSLNRCARHFLACAVSVRVTRAFDAARVLTVSCMAVIADTLMRCVASDVPSRLCLHFAGLAQVSKNAPFTVSPYGFSVDTTFTEQSQVMQFTDPTMITVRTKVLDYFHQQKAWLKPDHILFDWEKLNEGGGVGGANLHAFFKQICYDMGFPSTQENLPAYLSGEAVELIEFYPELAYYRDIIFYFKYLMSPTQESFPEGNKLYETKDAKLRWDYKGPGVGFIVQAFDGMLMKCLDEDLAAKQKEEGQRTHIKGIQRSRCATSALTISFCPVLSCYLRNSTSRQRRLLQIDFRLLLHEANSRSPQWRRSRRSCRRGS